MLYNSADQLLRWPGEHRYEYSLRGDLVEVKDDSTPPVTQRSYGYTPSGLLSSVVYAGAQNPASMLWDSDSNRVGFIDSSNQQTWQYVYDPTAGIPAVIEEVSSSGVVYYVREPGGELVASLRGGSVYYYHFDGLGSTRAMTNSTGNVTDTYTYDAWGNVTSHNGPTSQPYQFVGQLGYYTHYQEPNLGLMQLGVRFYDSEVGRFTQREPIEYNGGLNLYGYGDGNPTVFVDGSGLKRTFVGCSTNQRDEINKNLDDIKNNRLACITGGSLFASCVANRLDDIVINCRTNRNRNCSCACGFTNVPFPRKTINLCPGAFNSGACGCLGRTLIHEIGHSCNPTAYPPGEPPEGFQCEWDCYGKPGSPPCP